LVKNLKMGIAFAPHGAHNARSMAGLTLLKEKVDEAVGEGADLHEVEERVIEGAPVDADARDALWLYAWGLLERDEDTSPRFHRTR
jgi:hypothetical protein